MQSASKVNLISHIDNTHAGNHILITTHAWCGFFRAVHTITTICGSYPFDVTRLWLHRRCTCAGPPPSHPLCDHQVQCNVSCAMQRELPAYPLSPPSPAMLTQETVEECLMYRATFPQDFRANQKKVTSSQYFSSLYLFHELKEIKYPISKAKV